jgi:hypothetical protein
MDVFAPPKRAHRTNEWFQRAKLVVAARSANQYDAAAWGRYGHERPSSSW